MTTVKAIVVRAGPNGLAAAIELARAGMPVSVREATATIGGGARTEALTLPGFRHDVCSAVHPLAMASPFFDSLPLTQYGLEWVQPDTPLAHPLDDGTAVCLERSVDATAEGLDPNDVAAYRSLMAPLVRDWDTLVRDAIGPLRWPRHPLMLSRFGVLALRAAGPFARSRFRGERARALFAGLAAHSMLPLERSPSAAIALVLAAAGHAVGWPFPRGGSQAIADALAGCLEYYRGEIATSAPVNDVDHIRRNGPVLLDLTPRQVIRVAGHRLPTRYRRALARYRYGPGAFKLDWALSGPIPWVAAACRRAGTVHLGGTLDEIARAERRVWEGSSPESPFVLLSQPSVFDGTRAPPGYHTAWAYCHVPHGSTADMTQAIEDQVERFAPGFKRLILARRVMAPADLERHDPNLIGGDINGGVQDLRQLFFRPTFRLPAYTTPLPWLYICSASTPPGGGVHGLCGYFAAQEVLRRYGWPRPAPSTGP